MPMFNSIALDHWMQFSKYSKAKNTLIECLSSYLIIIDLYEVKMVEKSFWQAFNFFLETSNGTEMHFYIRTN